MYYYNEYEHTQNSKQKWIKIDRYIFNATWFMENFM